MSTLFIYLNNSVIPFNSPLETQHTSLHWFWKCIIHHIIISSTNIIIIITVNMKQLPLHATLREYLTAESTHTQENNGNLFIFIIIWQMTFNNNKYTNNALCVLIWIGGFTVNVHVWTLRCYRLTRDWVTDLIFQSHRSRMITDGDYHIFQHLLSQFLKL